MTTIFFPFSIKLCKSFHLVGELFLWTFNVVKYYKYFSRYVISEAYEIVKYVRLFGILKNKID